MNLNLLKSLQCDIIETNFIQFERIFDFECISFSKIIIFESSLFCNFNLLKMPQKI